MPTSLKIVSLYLLAAIGWIVATHEAFGRMTGNPALLIRLHLGADALLIAATAAAFWLERRQAERRHAQIEEQFRMMADSTYDWEYWINQHGQLSYVSPSCERITGYSAQEFLARPELLLLIMRPGDLARLPNLHEPPDGEDGMSAEFRIVTKTGDECWIGHVCRRVCDSQRQPMGIRVSNRDITTRKRYEELERSRAEELYQTDKMITLGTLVSGVAHEINNPTNFITLNAPLLQEAWQGASVVLEEHYQREGDFYVGRFKYSVMRERIEQLFNGVFEGANRIKRIVASLKDFARPDPSDMNQQVNVNEVIRSAITLLKNPIEKRTRHFSAACDAAAPLLIGSAQKLEQVMINLIQNSLESLSSEENAVSVRSKYEPEQRQIVIEVRDEGGGIAPDVLPHIFDPFFTTKRNSGGTGLGLSISERIVKEHGGKMTFESELGKGTLAKIALPVNV